MEDVNVSQGTAVPETNTSDTLNPREALSPEVREQAQSQPPSPDPEPSFMDQKRAELAAERGDEIPEDVSEALHPESAPGRYAEEIEATYGPLPADATDVQREMYALAAEIGPEKINQLGGAMQQQMEQMYAQQTEQLQNAARTLQIQAELNNPEIAQAQAFLAQAQYADPSAMSPQEYAQFQQTLHRAQAVMVDADQKSAYLNAIEAQHQAAAFEKTVERLQGTYGPAFNEENVSGAVEYAANRLGVHVNELANVTDRRTIQLMMELYRTNNRKAWDSNTDTHRVRTAEDGSWADKPHLRAAYEAEQKRSAQRAKQASAQARGADGKFQKANPEHWTSGVGSFGDWVLHHRANKGKQS